MILWSLNLAVLGARYFFPPAKSKNNLINQHVPSILVREVFSALVIVKEYTLFTFTHSLA
jgi:hypothetical protein